jgi:hypothetical protein
VVRVKVHPVSVEIPGGPYYVRELSARAALRLEAATKAAAGDTEKLVVAQLVAYVCNADGGPMLTPESADALLDQPQAAILALVKAGSEVNGFGEDPKGNS